MKTFLTTVATAALSSIVASCSNTHPVEHSPGTFLAEIVPEITIEEKVQPGESIVARMSYYDVPAVSIAIVEDWKITGLRAFGVTSKKDNTPATPDTLFQAASISKSVAAVTALKLVHEGMLSLDTDVGAYLKRWQLPQSDLRQGKDVTLRLLLSHMAGLGQSGFAGYSEGAATPSLTGVLSGDGANHPAITFTSEPGAEFSYSGGGTTVAQMAMEDHTGMNFEKLTKAYVFDPLDMASSKFDQPPGDDRISRAAHGHNRKGAALEGGRWHIYPELAAAGLWTTPEDLAVFMIAVSNSLRGEKRLWLSTDMADEAIGKYEDGTYGLGFRISGENENLAFSHTGANEGFRARALMFPYLGKGLVVMTNGELGGHLIGEIFAAGARHFRWPEVGAPRRRNTISLTEDEKDALAGYYLLPGDDVCSDRLVVIKRLGDGGLEVTFSGFVARILADSEDYFFIVDSPLSIGVLRDEYGAITGLSSFVNDEPYMQAMRTHEGVCK